MVLFPGARGPLYTGQTPRSSGFPPSADISNKFWGKVAGSGAAHNVPSLRNFAAPSLLKIPRSPTELRVTDRKESDLKDLGASAPRAVAGARCPFTFPKTLSPLGPRYSNPTHDVTATEMSWSDDDRGPALLASIWTLQGITLIVFAIRIWSRLTPKFALTAADYTITVALIARSVSVGFATAAIANGFGKHTADIPYSGLMVLGNYLFATFLTAVPAACFARISIACLLLQITLSRKWRILIWSTIVLQALLMLVYDTVHLAQCRSVITRKAKIDTTSCLTPDQVWSFTYANISVSMFSDFVCALIPICLIRRLTRSLVEKILVSILLASSLFATVCGIPKIYYMITFDFTSKDGYFIMTNQFLWSRLEEGIIIIAACAPLLKVPVERAMARLGFPTFDNPVPNEFVMVSSSRLNVCDPEREGAEPGAEKHNWAQRSTAGGLDVGASTSTASERSYHLYGSDHDQGLRA
ncbi:hypothetical protein MMYC01_205976 [Madurella mycetomatis]|uniref:Rhodopsin domain-containing protein n=1 Tax=Madurella mycetomatis TaxID=100816 RepID=A0A175W2H0_9PEZI|nr:hypothetical protein MMYC01_205976 [Madurella mycetomatis]